MLFCLISDSEQILENKNFNYNIIIIIIIIIIYEGCPSQCYKVKRPLKVGPKKEEEQ